MSACNPALARLRNRNGPWGLDAVGVRITWRVSVFVESGSLGSAWTAKDPISFSGGTTNLYEYAANDPVNLVDRTGRSAALAIAEAVEVTADMIIGEQLELALVESGGTAAAAAGIAVGPVLVAGVLGGVAVTAVFAVGYCAIYGCDDPSSQFEDATGSPSGSPIRIPDHETASEICAPPKQLKGGGGPPEDCGAARRASLSVADGAPLSVRTRLVQAADKRYQDCINAGGTP